MPPARRVFLAHTTDLRPYVEAAKGAVVKARDAYVEMTTFPASPTSAAEQCRTVIRDCDLFVVIAGPRWGSPTAGGSSFVEMELAEATRLGLPLLVFPVDGPPADRRQERFLDRLRHGGTVFKSVADPDDLRFELHAALVALPRRAVPVRRPYLGLVDCIAPPELVGRAEELALLADYCTAPARLPYLWLRAPAWAGKSALLAWFVLHPPPEVDVVAFFVTARFAGQDNHRAFAHALLTQLAHLLGEEVPAGLTDADLALRLSTTLDAAAAHCADQGRRLVLVVDGLDEDRGIERDRHSIAALLPTHPFAGMRVVVSSRPHPPLPRDVAPGHPLADPAVLWPLGPSAAAEVIRDDLRADLDRLLDGTELERQVLEVVTASGGGLDLRDLAELTRQDERDLDDVLRSPAWRVLDRRPGDDQESYGLAHEELVVAVTKRLPLQPPRAQLRDWADGYGRRGWPPDTPAYLVDGYVRMLLGTDDGAASGRWPPAVPATTCCCGGPGRTPRPSPRSTRPTSSSSVAVI